MPEIKPVSAPEPKPAAEVEIRTFPFVVDEVRDAEGGRSKDFTIKGHAAVTEKWSHDLGGFRERIAKDAFDPVLARDPHVLHLIDHDTRYVLSSTRNKTLELRTDPAGLHMWSKVAPTSYAADLRILMERKDVDQSSFAFTVARDEWKITDEGGDEKVERTILEIGELFDVTTTAMGAYPQTDSQVAMRTQARARAIAEGLPDSHPADKAPDADPEGDAVEGTEAPPEDRVADEGSTAAPPVARVEPGLFALKLSARRGAEAARKRREELTRKVYPHYEDHKANRSGE